MVEPITCVPSAVLTMPAATPAAEPLLDPPGVRRRSCGLRVPRGSVEANSVVTVFPTITAPASRSAATLAPSRSERKPANSGEPFSVGMSAVSMMSLMPIGMPSIFERGPPAGLFHFVSLFLAFVVVVELIEQAAAIRLERPVINARRPAGIGRGVERFTALSLHVVANDEVAGDQIDFLPMVMHERRGGVDAGLEAQQPGAAAHLAVLVEVACEDFLLDARGIAGRRGPASLHVHAGKLKMRLVHRHGPSPAIIAVSSQDGKRSHPIGVGDLAARQRGPSTTRPRLGFRHWDRED